MATQKQIAEILSLSQQAVSACFGKGTGTVKLGPKTREDILRVAKQIGYVPNHLARSLRTGRSSSLGVIMPLCNDPYFACLIDALNMEALRRGYSLRLEFHLWSPLEEEKAFRRLLGAKVEGILCYPMERNSLGPDLRAVLERAAIPVVSLSDKLAAPYISRTVKKDYRREGEEIGRHLIKMGHGRLDLLSPGAPGKQGEEKLRGIRLAAQAAGRNISAAFVPFPAGLEPVLNPAAPASLAQREALIDLMVDFYLGMESRGTAVIVGNEKVAHKLLAKGARQGIRVPEDLSVVCSGLLGQGDAGPIPLTSAEYDPMEMAARAVATLLDPESRSLRIAPRLVARGSVRDLDAQPQASRMRNQSPMPIGARADDS